MKPGCWELSPQFQTTRRGDEPAGPVSGRQRSRHHRTVLFLTRDGDALLEAADLLLLWGRGWAERDNRATQTPPYRRTADTRSLSAGTPSGRTWSQWWNGLAPFDRSADPILRHLIDQGYLDSNGFRANTTIAATLTEVVDPIERFDDRHIRLRDNVISAEWRAVIADASQTNLPPRGQQEDPRRAQVQPGPARAVRVGHAGRPTRRSRRCRCRAPRT